MAEWPHAEEGHGRFQRGMGRGLSALLATSEENGGSSLREIALELIRPNPHQPRQDFDGERAARPCGVDQGARCAPAPRWCARCPGGGYELVAGERRLARFGSWPVSSWCRRSCARRRKSERLEIALIENMAREDLSPIEEARACATLVDDLGDDARRSSAVAWAAAAWRSRTRFRLLDLPDEAQAMLQSSELSAGHGRALLDVQGPRRPAALGVRGTRSGLVGARDRAAGEERADRRGGAQRSAATPSPSTRTSRSCCASPRRSSQPPSDGACASVPRALAARSSSTSTIRARPSSWRLGSPSTGRSAPPERGAGPPLQSAVGTGD